MPVFITKGALFHPYAAKAAIDRMQNLTLHCGGAGNKIETLKKPTATLICKDGNFTLDGKSYKLADLKCSKIPTSDLLVTKTACAENRGVIFDVGFQVGNNFYGVFKICYDTKNERTIYSKSIVNGPAQSFKIKESTRPSFRAGGIGFNTTVINNYYTTKGQILRFEKVFGSKQPYVNSTMFMARGHLSPDADFVFPYEQFATYYYANCAPEWQVVDAGNWFLVENATRNLAQKLSSDVVTYTGTLGVLELKNPSTGALTPIHLGPHNDIPAPKWYYKVVMSIRMPVELVFISLNNPFVHVGKEVEFCKNVCAKYGINLSSYTDSSKGYTFCCELKDFWAAAMKSKKPYFQ